MRITPIALLAFIGIAGSAAADCIGDGDLRTCYDSNSGNSYTTMDLGGGMRTTNGYNSRTGSSWDQTTIDLGGGMSTTTGHAADGDSWSRTDTDLGNGIHSFSGVDSDGESFSGTYSEE